MEYQQVGIVLLSGLASFIVRDIIVAGIQRHRERQRHYEALKDNPYVHEGAVFSEIKCLADGSRFCGSGKVVALKPRMVCLQLTGSANSDRMHEFTLTGVEFRSLVPVWENPRSK